MATDSTKKLIAEAIDSVTSRLSTMPPEEFRHMLDQHQTGPIAYAFLGLDQLKPITLLIPQPTEADKQKWYTFNSEFVKQVVNHVNKSIRHSSDHIDEDLVETIIKAALEVTGGPH